MQTNDQINHDGALQDAAASSWLANFRRITSSGRFIPEIDGLRFVAVSMVLIYHVLVFVCNKKDLGVGGIGRLARGVEMFFVLSGFILALPFAAQFLRGGRRVSLKDYFLRRLTRLEPPYLVCLLVYTILKWYQDPNLLPVIVRVVPFDAVYLHNLVFGRPWMMVSVAWSLEVEVQFYLLMPLLAFVFALRPTWLRRAIMAAVILLVPLVQPIWLPARVWPNDGHVLNSLQYFFAGILLADIWVIEWNNAPPPLSLLRFSWCDLAWLLFYPVVLLVPRNTHFPERFWLPSVIFVLYLAMFRSLWIRRFMRVQIVTLIGGMCYSIYLMHNLVIGLIGYWLVRSLPYSFWPAAAVSGVVMIPWSLFVSAIYFRLIERPCMRRNWPQLAWGWLMARLFVEEEPARTP